MEGVIVTGRGLATAALHSDSTLVNGFYDINLCPGSMNLVLNKPINLLTELSVNYDQKDSNLKRRWFWEAKIDNHFVLLTRWRLCPFHIVECLSEFNFKQNGYQDGDIVSIIIDKKVTLPLSALQSLVWNILWLGRQKLWYRSYIYWRIVRLIRINKVSGCSIQ
jgi:hypothetical protein